MYKVFVTVKTETPNPKKGPLGYDWDEYNMVFVSKAKDKERAKKNAVKCALNNGFNKYPKAMEVSADIYKVISYGYL